MTFFYHTDIDSLIYDLGSLNVETDTATDASLVRGLMQKVLQHDLCDADAGRLFPQVVKLLASSDIATKKLVCWFITQHCYQETFLVLAINTLMKDCRDSNPVIRGLALKTITALPESYILQYGTQLVIQALKDRSPYVRRVAALSCIRIHQAGPDVLHDHGAVDELYNMLRDQDPIVITNSLSALDEILRSEGGVVINRNIAYHLLNKLGLLTEWGLVVALRHLQQYKPRTEDEAIEVMNVIDVYLKHTNCAVVTESLVFFLKIIKPMPHLRTEVFKRAKGQIFHFIGAGNHELTLELLEFVETLLVTDKDIFSQNYGSFFCKYNEPLYLKQKKIKLLPVLATKDNIKEMIEELHMYCTDVSALLAHEAILAIGKIGKLVPSHVQFCLQNLLSLLQFNIDHVCSSVLVVLKTLPLSDIEQKKSIMTCVYRCIDIVSDDNGKCAILWLLGENGQYLQDSTYLLEKFVDCAVEETSPDVQLHLLTAAMKLFFKKPGECQELLGKLLEVCINSRNIDVQERGLFYYKLLKVDVNEAQAMVCFQSSN